MRTTMAASLLIVLGWIVSVVAAGLAITAALFVGVGPPLPPWSYFIIFPGMVAAGSCTFVGDRIRLAGRRLRSSPIAAPGQDAVFVLYLRAFRSDPQRGRIVSGPTRAGALVPMLHLDTLVGGGGTHEEHLIGALKRFGLTVALGRPGETVPPLGARRLYPEGSDWRKTVGDLMSRARLVVIVLDAGRGTAWEVLEAPRRLPPQRLVLVLPASEAEYLAFQEVYRSEAGDSTSGSRRLAFPDYPAGQAADRGSAEFAGLIVYPAGNWKAQVRRMPAPVPLLDIPRVALRRALSPVHEQLTHYEANLAAAKTPARLSARRAAEILDFLSVALLLSSVVLVALGLLQLGVPQNAGEWLPLASVLVFVLAVCAGTRWQAGKKKRQAIPPRR